MPAKVTASEMEILRLLDLSGRATATELHGRLTASHGWAHSTVVTFLRRLEAKGLVRHVRVSDSRAFVYQATPAAGVARRSMLRKLLDGMFGGNVVPLVSSLLEETHLEPVQLAELRRMIDQHLNKRRKD